MAAPLSKQTPISMGLVLTVLALLGGILASTITFAFRMESRVVGMESRFVAEIKGVRDSIDDLKSDAKTVAQHSSHLSALETSVRAIERRLDRLEE